MKITIIGEYGAYPHNGGGCNCYLLQSNDTNIVLDMGSGALSGITKFIDLKDIDAIILSHLHYDHMSDMLPLIYYADINNVQFKIYCPNTDSTALDIIKSCKNFEIVYINEGDNISINELDIEFTEMIHGLKSYASKITSDDKCVVYSGDTAYCDKVIPLCSDCDVAILDCGNADGTMTHHMSIPQAEEISQKANCSVIASHLFPGFTYSSANPNVLIAQKNLIIDLTE